jgi:phospholipase C
VPPAAPGKLFQEQGSRLSRPAPYVLHVGAGRQTASLALTFRNDGAAGAVFHVYDRTHLERIPRRYTVEAGRSLTDSWEVGGGYDLWVLGPNGFVREFSGHAEAPEIDVTLVYLAAERAVELQLTNRNETPVSLSLESRAYRPAAARKVEVAAHRTMSLRWDVSASGNWYDLILLTKKGFVRRFAGRLETGKNGVSDPAMGAV